MRIGCPADLGGAVGKVDHPAVEVVVAPVGGVVTRAAIQRFVRAAEALAQRVIAGPAIKRIGAIAAIEGIRAAHAEQHVAEAVADDRVIAIAADRILDPAEAGGLSGDAARHTIQTDDRIGGDGCGVHGVRAAIAVGHGGGMTADTGIIGIFVRVDIAVVRAGRAPGPDDDIRDRQHIATGIVDNPHRPGAGGTFATERLAFEGPGAVEII